MKTSSSSRMAAIFVRSFSRSISASSSSRLSSEEGVVQKAVISRLFSGVDHRSLEGESER